MVIKYRVPSNSLSSWLILVYIFLAMIVIAVLFLNTVKVPYEITEIEIVKEPKTETITINYTEPYEVRETKTEQLPVTYEECGYKDINISVEYIGDLSKMAYDYRSKTGYLSNPASGNNPEGRYLQRARVCNADLYEEFMRTHEGLKIVFEVCFFFDGKEVECPNKITMQVLNKPCKDTADGDMMWVAPFDSRRDIKLRPLSITQKWTCEEKTRFIPGKETQIVKILQREKQRIETKQTFIDKKIEKKSTIQVTLWEKLRRDYGF